MSRWARAALVLVVLTVGATAVVYGVTVSDWRHTDTCKPPDDAYARMILSDGAIGYWRLNETTGRTAQNAAPLGEAGKYVGRHMLNEPGVFPDDTAIELHGTGQYVAIPTYTPYQNLSNWSVEAWVNPAAPTSKGADIAFLAHAWDSSSIPFVLGYGSFNASYSDARHAWTGFYRSFVGTWSRKGEVTGRWSRVADSIVLPTNSWTHLTGTYDGAMLRLYKNGRLVNETAATENDLVAGDVPLYIGSRWWLGAQHFFSGSVDEVALYPVALTPDQIENHYECAT